MLILSTWLLATALSAPTPGTTVSRRIDVDCRIRRSLTSALVRAKLLDDVDIVLHGVCEGHFLIDTDGVTLRGADSASGLAAPDGDTSRFPVLEVNDARTTLRRLVVRGGEVGVLARGWDAEVLLVGVDVQGQSGAGVLASRGAFVRLLDATVHDGDVGIAAESDAELNLQNVSVNHERVGVVVSRESAAALNDSTITDNREAGVSVDTRSDVNVLGGVFRDNGQVHIGATDGSSVNLLFEVTIGSSTDATPFALSVGRGATIGSYSTPLIHGDVSVLDGASIRLGNTVLDGDLLVQLFSNAHVRSSTITGYVVCYDGGEAICSQVTSAGALDCPSSTCGSPTNARTDGAPGIRKPPAVEVPRFVLPRRASP